jgi:hypothetical protein
MTVAGWLLHRAVTQRADVCECVLQVARAMGKKLIVVYESDVRHGGGSDYVALCREATGNRWPECAPMADTHPGRPRLGVYLF